MGVRKGMEAQGWWQVKGEIAGEGDKCSKKNGLHDPLSTSPWQPTPTVTRSSIFLMGWSVCFHSHHHMLTRVPLKNRAVSLLCQRFGTLPTESFLRVFTVRNRKRRLPSKLFPLSIALLQGLWCENQKYPKRRFRQELKSLGVLHVRSQEDSMDLSVLFPFLLTLPGLQSRAWPNQQQGEKAEQRKEGETTHRVTGGEGLSVAETHLARQLWVKECSNYVLA